MESRKRIHSRVVSGLFLTVALAGWAWCADYCVAPGGDDAWPGTSSLPWRTLQKAADSVRPGDTVTVRAGTYAGFRSKSGGSPGLPITFVCEVGAAVTISGPGPQSWHGSVVCIEGDESSAHGWWVIDGFEVTGATSSAGIDIRGYPGRPVEHVSIFRCHVHHNRKWGIFTSFADHFTAEYNECESSAVEHGIYHSNSGDDAVIRFNDVHDNNACGIQINADPSMGGDGVSSRCEVSSNTLYRNGAAGGAAINLASVRDSTVCNNLIFDNLAGGIAMWDDGQGVEWGCKGNRVVFNTVHMPSGGRWALNMIDGSTGNTIQCNILVHDGSRGGIEADSGSLSGLASDFNVMKQVSLDDVAIGLPQWQAQNGQDAHSQNHAPLSLFVDPSVDRHLAPSSWARNHGVCQTGIDADLDAVPRPQEAVCDIGCYEYVSPGPPRGDIDGNGKVDAVDAAWFSFWMAGVSIPYQVALSNADINQDGRLDVLDLMGILHLAPGVSP